jgi:hypothetical protein
MQEYINSSVSSKLREFLVDIESVHAREAELKSRVAPTDAARRQELISIVQKSLETTAFKSNGLAFAVGMSIN